MATKEQIRDYLSKVPVDQMAKIKSLDIENQKMFMSRLSQKLDGLEIVKPRVQSDVDKSLNRQQTRMDSRPDMLREGIDEMSRQGLGYMINPLNVGNNLKVVGGLAQRATAAVVNPMIEAQRQPSFGKMGQALVDPRIYGEQVKKGLAGQRLGEVGDLITGAGGNETQSAVGGLALEAMLLNPQAVAKGIVGAPKAIMNAPKTLASLPGQIATVGKNLINKIPQVAEMNALKTMIPQAEKEIDNLAKGSARISEYLNVIKSRNSKQANSLGYRGAQGMKDSIEASFSSVKQNYARIIENIKGETVPLSDANRLLNDLIVDGRIGEKTILDHSEQDLLDLQKIFSGKLKMSGETRLPTGENIFTTAEVLNPGLDASELKSFKNIVRQAIKNRPDLEANFYREYGQILENNGMGELSGANKAYKNAYDAAKEAKALKRTKLTQIATGSDKVPLQEIADLASSEKPYGTEYTKKAREIFEKYRDAKLKALKANDKVLSDKAIKEEFLKKLNETLKNKRDSFKTRLYVAEAIGGASLVTGLIKRKS